MIRPQLLAAVLAAVSSFGVVAQSINSGTVSGAVTDPSGAVIAKASVRLRNAITGFERTVESDDAGAFRFNSVPTNHYRLSATAAGFTPDTTEIDVRNAIPVSVKLSLKIAADVQAITVEGVGGATVESDPSAHQDVDRSSFLKLPAGDAGGQLGQLITLSTGAVASDANGFFHPLGDHAQTSFVVDGQPISDQQSKLFSTQIPANALQGMELISGSPDAQYGDKSSLIVNATTRSGLGATKAFGSVESTWGSFGAWGGNAALGFGAPAWGNFIALNGARSGHFLDTPELRPIHDVGNNSSIFDRFDWQPTPKDAIHFNLFVARNWFQVPNSLDQLGQDQKQRVLTWSVAPGFQHTFNGNMLLTVNPFTRRDELNYYGSRDPFADTPATASQARFLTNYGVKADLAVTHGRHNWKIGVQIQQTKLDESFRFGITDPAYNPVCLDANGDAAPAPGVTNPAGCSRLNASYTANPDLLPGIVPYDLTRGGSLFRFHGKRDVNQFAFYVTDSVKIGNLTLNLGLRGDRYDGLTSADGVQPRVGAAYLLSKTHTVFRLAYARTFETPFNENLILSSGTGEGGLAEHVFGSQSAAIQPGRRNQYNAGLQQGLGKWVIVDADYFWKYTQNAYDFSVFFNTPITFPIAWKESRLDGVTARVSSIGIHGFQAYLTLGHTRARYFGPEVGGLIPLGGFSNSVFRIDHDQAYQQTVVLRYQRPHNGEWVNFTWRYDSGLVVSGVPDVDAVLGLTAAQQVAIGFACGGVRATLDTPITSCAGTGTSTLLTLPQTGKENDDHNPDRVKPRSLLSLAVGTDNLFHSEKGPRFTARFSVENLTNRVSLYNFLSTFSGTHFVSPRTFQASLGYTF